MVVEIEKIKTGINESVRGVIDAFKKTPFIREEEIQWYFHHQFRCKIDKYLGDKELIQREHKTKNLYIRGNNGLLNPAPEKVHGKKRSRGKFDLVILNPAKNEDEILVAVEIKYPRGKGKKEYFEVNCKNDCIKLTDNTNNVKEKYLLYFIYNDTLPVKSISEEDIKGINFAYIEFGKKPMLFPEGWLK